MKLFRYRRPSWKTMLGVTKAKKRIKRQLGITALMKPFRWWTNQKRRLKRQIGYESDAGRVIRKGLPRPVGCLVLVIGALMLIAYGVTSLCHTLAAQTTDATTLVQSFA